MPIKGIDQTLDKSGYRKSTETTGTIPTIVMISPHETMVDIIVKIQGLIVGIPTHLCLPNSILIALTIGWWSILPSKDERLINAEEQGRLKETAALAVRTAIRRNSGDLSEESSCDLRLGPLNCDTEGSHPNDVATERIRRPPISSRLGASEDDLPAVLTAAKPSTRTIKGNLAALGSKKSKDGAKDGAKKIPGSPALLLGTSSRKRKVQQTKQSNVRKKLQVDAEGVGKSTRGRSSRGTSSHGGSPHEDVPTNSRTSDL
ncbi:hypothetical protein Bca101_022999 [Brassica carinata]